MSEAKMTEAEVQQLRSDMAAAPRRTIKIGTTAYLYIGAPDEKMTAKIDTLIQTALNRGKTVIENGVKQWIRRIELVNTREFGSAQYKWRGDQVKCVRWLITEQPDGTQRRKRLGYGWKNLD